MEAAAIGDVESVKYLLTITKDIDDENEDGTTALIEASRNGYVQVITLLLDAGADIEHYDEMWGDTPLLKAAYNCRPMAVRLLVERGANILHQDKVCIEFSFPYSGPFSKLLGLPLFCPLFCLQP